VANLEASLDRYNEELQAKEQRCEDLTAAAAAAAADRQALLRAQAAALEARDIAREETAALRQAADLASGEAAVKETVLTLLLDEAKAELAGAQGCGAGAFSSASQTHRYAWATWTH